MEETVTQGQAHRTTLSNPEGDLFNNQENDLYLITLSFVPVVPPRPQGTFLGEPALGSLDSEPGTALTECRLKISAAPV